MVNNSKSKIISLVVGVLVLLGLNNNVAVVVVNGFVVPKVRLHQEYARTILKYQQDAYQGYTGVRPILADQQSASLFTEDYYGAHVGIRPMVGGGSMVPSAPTTPRRQRRMSQGPSSPIPQQPQPRVYGASTGNNYQYDNTMSLTTVQGGSRRTFHHSPHYQGAPTTQTTTSQDIYLQSDGNRPVEAEYEVWQGPDHTASRVRVYSEDGGLRPFRAVVHDRGSYYHNSGHGHTVSVRNAGPMEFPLVTSVGYQPQQQQQLQPYLNANSQISTFMDSNVRSPYPYDTLHGRTPSRRGGGSTVTVQGGALKTWSFRHDVSSVQVTLSTEGLPLCAIVEHCGVDNHVKQVAEIHQDDGARRPFVATIATPGGSGDTIAIRNTGPLEFPITATVEPLQSHSNHHHHTHVTGGTSARAMALRNSNHHQHQYQYQNIYSGDYRSNYRGTNYAQYRNGVYVW